MTQTIPGISPAEVRYAMRDDDTLVPANVARPDEPDNQVLPPAATVLAKDSILSPVARPSNSWQSMLQQLGADANAGIVSSHKE